jgi:hypothetical protein
MFPAGSAVWVDTKLLGYSRYTGHGIVVGREGTDAGQLAVELENGNTWWYDVLACRPALDSSEWPAWLKRRVRAISSACKRAKVMSR